MSPLEKATPHHLGDGEGQSSCLENPRDGGASWAAVYGIAQSWTRLKQLSSSHSRGTERPGMLQSMGSQSRTCLGN